MDQQVNHWRTSARSSLKSAGVLFKSRRYDASLFFGHLALEKLLKGLVTKKIQKAAPYSHDLERLALITEIPLTEEKISQLKTITEFNVASRYDDFKASFYKKCTREYTQKHFLIIKKLYSWLEKEYQQK